MLPIEWQACARDDLWALLAQVGAENPQAALALGAEIELKVEALAHHPKLYARSQRATGYRQLTVRPNYIVYYQLQPDERTPVVIEIVAVVHARQQWPGGAG